ncbi:MAG: hypothetical protein EU530_01745 [Promethearchaeota archaeon]|nr:MAG: hypothetical protein EU530_01745 [Candidatus Lokiarchaeota archaeon]
MSNQNLLSIIATNYPNAILLGNKQYDLTFQIINNSNKPEQVKFHFTTEGINADIPKKYLNPIVVDPGRPFIMSVPISPTVNGSAKLILQSNIYQEVKYTELVWHVRKEVPPKRAKEALSKSFVKFKDLTKGAKKPLRIKNGKSLTLDEAAKEYEKVYSSPIDQIEKDSQLKDIAQRVFSADVNFAFEILKMVQNQASIQELLADFICAAIETNRDLSISKIDSLLDVKIKDALLEKMIPFLLEKDLSLAIQLCMMINNPEVRDPMIRDIFNFSYLKQFDEAIALLNAISNPILQLSLHYEIIKILKQSNPTKCDALLQSLIQKSSMIGEIEILADLLVIAALVHTPQWVADIIGTFPPEVKDPLNKIIRDTIWNEIKEEKIRIDEVPVSSLYYGFNVMARPTPVISKVSEMGGTVSSNLIDGNMNSVIGIVNLFSFNFPIYPTIEQCYAEINSEKGKSFYYLIIPLKNADETSYEMVQMIIKNLFVANAHQVPHKMYIFNLDFIPYLSKPTIIVEDDPEENIVIQSIIKRIFKNENVSLIIDDGLFKEGKINTWIKSILPSSQFKLLNLVLTYDFLNNYSMFKKFMNEFVR